MKTLTRRDFLKAAVAGSAGIAASLALAACAKGAEDNTGASNANPSSASNAVNNGNTAPSGSEPITNISVSSEAEEAEYVDLKAGIKTNWDTPTCFRTNIAQDAYCAPLVYERLGWLDQKNTYIPWGCKGWSTNDNGFSYDFELYDYITDSEGNKITSEDLVWFIQTCMEKAMRPNFSKLESAEVTGPYTFKVKLKSNQVGVLGTLICNDGFLVSRAAVEASGDDFTTSCVSTSPYRLTSCVSGVGMVFEKREDYWQKDESLIPVDMLPRADKVTLSTYAEASQMGNALEAGEIDFALELAASTAILFQGDDRYSIQEYTKANGIQLFFSGADNRPVAEDENLRKAIATCINPDLIISSVYQGFAGYMYDTANEMAYGYLPKWKEEEYYPYDVEKAKEYLAASDYQGQSLVILVSGTFKAIGEILISCMDAIGIKAEILTGDLAWITANRLDGTLYDMFINQVNNETLPTQWSIRFDPNSYSTGDGTSRHDYVLAELLYKTWTEDGFTEENIDEVHKYIKDHMYAYGLVDHHMLNVWNNRVNMIECVSDVNGNVHIQACRYGK